MNRLGKNLNAGIITALFAVIFLCLSGMAVAHAQQENGDLYIDLANDRVDITTGFTGARFVLYGVKEEQGDLAIVVRGPERSAIVRRKSQVAGFWMNTDSVMFKNVPVYYDLAMSVTESKLAPATILKENGIGLDSLEFDPRTRKDPDVIRRFKEALIRNKQVLGHFTLEPRNIVFINGDFFRADFQMPANVPTGDYTIQTYLFKNGTILEQRTTQLRVAQVGMSAKLRNFAMTNEFLYALCCVLFAIASGAGAYYFLRKD